jgi:ribose/galactose isomerase
MRIAIGADHAGFALKEAVTAFLTAERREVLDLGTYSTDPVDYSDYAEAGRSRLAREPGRARHLALRERGWRVDGREQDSRDSRRIVP